jgi:hypothetical protein
MRTIAGALLIVAGAICFVGGTIATEIANAGPKMFGPSGWSTFASIAGGVLGLFGLVLLLIGLLLDDNSKGRG